MNHPLVLAAFGVIVGIFSGLMGLGGGAVIIPILVLVFLKDQQMAHGTSLAMILSPTALPAIYKYHLEGKVDWRLVMWVIPGMLLGSYFGAKLATSIPSGLLRLLFGFVLIYVAAYTIFSSLGREHLVRTLVLSGIVVTIALLLFGTARWYDGRAVPATSVVNPLVKTEAHG